MEPVPVSIEETKVSLKVAGIVFATAFVPIVASFTALAFETRANALAIAEQKAVNKEVDERFSRETERTNEYMLRVTNELTEIKTILRSKRSRE